MCTSLVVVDPLAAAAVAARTPAAPRDTSVAVRDAATPVRPLPAMPRLTTGKVTWPAGGSADLALPAGGTLAAVVGGLPVTVGGASLVGRTMAGGATATPRRLGVRVLPRAQAQRAGFQLMLAVSRSDGEVAAGRVHLTLGYAAFRDAVGADFDNRLTLVRLPACALTTPQRSGCLAQTPLTVTNAPRTASLSADLDVAGNTVIALLSGGSSDIGDYTKTDFHPDYAWQGGGSGGNFTMSYPMAVPPVPGSLTPSVALNYSSGNVDGQTVGVNVQPFWGEGWNYTPGYVERSYRACRDDTANAPIYTITTGDACWRLPNARMVLNGRAVELVLGDDGVWRADSDDAAKVELVTGGVNTHYWNNEHWKVSTPDGTVYYFGLTQLPGWQAGDRETASVLGEPVFSNHTGEPCVNAQGAGWTNSWCAMAYRWNLDYVVDRNGNTMSYWYTKETNQTALGGDPNHVTGYDRFGRLTRIEYGTRGGTGTTRESSPTATPPARVQFTATDRCATAGPCPTHDRANYPDTAWDLDCAAAPCSNNLSPSFWSSQRISQISTEIYSGTGTTYTPVDSWALGAQFPSDASGNPLWLSSITRTGQVGGTLSLPSMQFTGTRLRNRADWDPNGTMADPQKYRITAVRTETGGEIDVNYSAQDPGCQFGLPFPKPDNNSNRCFPRYWTNPSGSSGWAWWHKYVVTSVVQKDLVGGSPDVQTSYDYSYDPSTASTSVMWSHDDGAMIWSTPGAYKSYADWRGYPTVTTTVGTVAGQQSQTKVLYYRGLDEGMTDAGENARVSTLTNSLGEVVHDSPQFEGVAYETQLLDGPGGQVLSKTISDMSRITLTGTETHSDTWTFPTLLHSYISRPTRERMLTWLPATGTWRTTEKDTTWDPTYGVISQVSDLGDVATAGDNLCVRSFYTFPAAGAPYLVAYPNRVQSVGVDCATTPTFPHDAVSETRTFYDGATAYATAPTSGNATRVDGVVSYTGTTPNVITTKTTTYDQWGRVATAADALGHTGRTDYTQTNGLVTGATMTNPLGQTGTKTFDPTRGLVLTATDPNLKVTTGAYDPLGRLLKVWHAGHPTTGVPDTEYQYTEQAAAPSFIRTRSLGPNGNQIDAYEIYDGFDRLRQTQATAPDGFRTIRDDQFDGRGLQVKESTFYNNASGPTGTLVAATDASIDRQLRYTYDQAGRQTAEQLWSQNVFQYATTTVYSGDRTATVPPTGGTVTQDVFDGRGRLIEKRLYLTSNLSGSYKSTTYQYDNTGQLATVTDPIGSHWTYSYDLFGRKTQVVDPDAGTSTSVYDNAGRVTSTTDGRGQKLFFDYDNLDRKTKEHADTATGTVLATWTWDTVSKGQLTASSRIDASGTFKTAVGSYDNTYQPLSTTVTAPGFGASGASLTYKVTNTYKTNGDLATTTVPAAGGLPSEKLTYAYNNAGFATTLTSPTATYVSGRVYTYDGLVTSQDLGASGKRVRLGTTYDPATRRVTGSTTALETATVGTFTTKYSTDYAYDQAGNVTSVAGKTNSVADEEECFGYDYLRRMTQAWTQTSGACTTPQATGADPYQRQWTFDDAGNWLTQTDVNTTAGNTTWTYQVGAAFGVAPHQVKNVLATGPLAGTATRTFSYDTSGNTLTRTSPTGTAQTLTWDKEGRLATDTQGGSSYVYDADGHRLVVRTATKSTLYLGDGTQLDLPAGGGTTTATRYYGGFAVRTASALTWVAGDAHATSTVQVDSVTLTPQRRRPMPYGDTRGAQPTWVGNKGFVGGTSDDTGLVHLGAREYDPTLGRFVSVDPVLDLTNPQQWNAYTYSNSNPLTWSDPSGQRFIDDDYNSSSPSATANAAAAAAGRLSGHDAVAIAYGYMAWVILAFKGITGTVTVDVGAAGRKANTIKGASGNNPGVNDGYADIIFRGKDADGNAIIYVWEVKPGNDYGRTEGPEDLDRYITYLEKELRDAGDPTPVLPGPALVPAIPAVPSSDGWMRAWTEADSPGMVYYGRTSPPAPPVPVPVPKPVPVPNPTPGPAPHPVTAPRTVVQEPTTVPTPGIPQPTPNPWGPYGTPLPACNGGALACSAATEVVVVVGVPLLILAAVLAPEITIPALLGGGAAAAATA